MKIKTTVRIIAILPFLLILFLSGSINAEKMMSQKVNQPLDFAKDICPILIGATLPKLTLTKIDGNSFDLNAAIAAKPTVLIFYRGGW